MSSIWTEMSLGRRISFGLLATMLIGAVSFGIFYVTKTKYLALPTAYTSNQFADLLARSEKDIIDYQVDNTGTVLVNEKDLSKVQMLIQQNSNPAFESHGLELYDTVDYSMTEHTQKVTYQRALQGELERTITALGFIKNARVHLSFAERKLFSAEQQRTKAAVTVFPLYELSREQIRGIQHLVSSAVDGLTPADVTVLGADGETISSTGLAGDAAYKNNSHENSEQRLEQKASKVLEAFFDPSLFVVSVNVELDYSERKEVSQQILSGDGGKGAIKQQRENSRSSPSEGEELTTGTKSHEVEYLHGSRTEEIKDHPGKISRITLAAAIQANVSAPTLDQIRALLTASIGIDPNRGDLVSVEAVPPMTNGLSTEVVERQVAVTNKVQESKLNIDTPEQQKVSESAKPLDNRLLLLLIPGFLFCIFIGYRLFRIRSQQRQMTLLQVQQWLKEENHAR